MNGTIWKREWGMSHTHAANTAIWKHQKCYYALLLLSAFHFTFAYLFNIPQFEARPYALGHYPFPYQGRLLMALVFRAFMKWDFLTHLVQHAHKTLIHDPLQVVLGGVVFVSLLISAEAVRLSVSGLANHRVVAIYAGLLVPYMCYFHFVLNPIYPGTSPYDLPNVALFSLGLLTLLRRWWVAFFIVFIIATVNRETSCFLVLIMLAMEGSRLHHRRQYNDLWKPVGSALLLALVWAYLYNFSTHYFSAVPHHMDLHLRDNLRSLITPWQWPQLPSVFGFMWLPFVLLFRSIRHRGLQLCAFLIGVWFLIMLNVGLLYEIRTFGEWIPYIAICVSLAFCNWTAGQPGRSVLLAGQDVEHNATSSRVLSPT